MEKVGEKGDGWDAHRMKSVFNVKNKLFHFYFVQINFKIGGGNFENRSGASDEAQPSIMRHSGGFSDPTLFSRWVFL